MRLYEQSHKRQSAVSATGWEHLGSMFCRRDVKVSFVRQGWRGEMSSIFCRGVKSTFVRQRPPRLPVFRISSIPCRPRLCAVRPMHAASLARHLRLACPLSSRLSTLPLRRSAIGPKQASCILCSQRGGVRDSARCRGAETALRLLAGAWRRFLRRCHGLRAKGRYAGALSGGSGCAVVVPWLAASMRQKPSWLLRRRRPD